MNQDNSRMRYLNLYRQQLNKELDAMGYGQPSQPLAPEMPSKPAQNRPSLIMGAAALVFAVLALIQGI